MEQLLKGLGLLLLTVAVLRLVIWMLAPVLVEVCILLGLILMLALIGRAGIRRL